MHNTATNTLNKANKTNKITHTHRDQTTTYIPILDIVFGYAIFNNKKKKIHKLQAKVKTYVIIRTIFT